MKKIIITIFLLALVSTNYGQDTFKEIKSMTKKHSFEVGQKIKITGERTFIYISTWDQHYVEASIEVISRYSNKEQAKKDLEVIKVVFDKVGDEVFFSNAIQINDISEKPKSNLKTILHLTIPQYAEMNILNSFGELHLDGAVKKLDIETKFCTTTIMNYKGTLKMESNYDVVDMDNTRGEMKFYGNRSDLSLNGTENQVYVRMQFGELDVTFIDSNLEYEIETKYTPVSIYLNEGLDIYHELSCKDCNLITDKCQEQISEEKSKKEHRLTIGTDSKEGAKSKIQSESEDINIISVNSQTNN